MLNHQRMIMVKARKGTKLRWVTSTDDRQRMAENVAKIHQVHRASLPKPLTKGCFAVWSPYGTIPEIPAEMRLEWFTTISDAECAFHDRMASPHRLHTHKLAEYDTTTRLPVTVTGLSRLWIYRFDPRGTDMLPTYGLEYGPKGGLHRVDPNPVDDKLRQIIRNTVEFDEAVAQ